MPTKTYFFRGCHAKTAKEGNVVEREGCMSVPNFTGNMVRWARIVVNAFNEFGVGYGKV